MKAAIITLVFIILIGMSIFSSIRSMHDRKRTYQIGERCIRLGMKHNELQAKHLILQNKHSGLQSKHIVLLKEYDQYIKSTLKE
jgi:hypothetical protein